MSKLLLLCESHSDVLAAIARSKLIKTLVLERQYTKVFREGNPFELNTPIDYDRNAITAILSEIPFNSFLIDIFFKDKCPNANYLCNSDLHNKGASFKSFEEKYDFLSRIISEKFLMDGIFSSSKNILFGLDFELINYIDIDMYNSDESIKYYRDQSIVQNLITIHQEATKNNANYIASLGISHCMDFQKHLRENGIAHNDIVFNYISSTDYYFNIVANERREQIKSIKSLIENDPDLKNFQPMQKLIDYFLNPSIKTHLVEGLPYLQDEIALDNIDRTLPEVDYSRSILEKLYEDLGICVMEGFDDIDYCVNESISST